MFTVLPGRAVGLRNDPRHLFPSPLTSSAEEDRGDTAVRGIYGPIKGLNNLDVGKGDVRGLKLRHYVTGAVYPQDTLARTCHISRDSLPSYHQ